jgi:hypothetical protein
VAFRINCFATPLRLACRKGFGYGEVRKMREVRCRTRGQACSRREAISAQARVPRARLATGKAATDTHEVSQRPPQLVGKRVPLLGPSLGNPFTFANFFANVVFPAIHQRKDGFDGG